MKRLLMLSAFALSIALVVWASDFPTVTVSKTFVIGDTVSWTDTFLSDWVNIDGATKIHAYVDLGTPPGHLEDTNFGSDSFFINLQLSMDRVTVTKTFELDTLLDNGSGWTGADMIAADSLRGNYARAMLIWHDTVNVDSAVTFGRSFGKTFKLLYNIQR